ncbi:MAG: LemA family protein [bacterium]
MHDPVEVVAIVLLAILGLILIVAIPWFQYNRMVTLRNRCSESWSNVDTELKRRYDLIPNLVATVKGYAAHEKEVLTQVVQARAAAIASSTTGAARHAANENALVGAMNRLLAVAEAYPTLRANTNFLQLQTELALTEDRIQAARRFYNANVRDFRNQTHTFPGVFFAGWFGMRDIAFFEVGSPAFRVAPTVRVA